MLLTRPIHAVRVRWHLLEAEVWETDFLGKAPTEILRVWQVEQWGWAVYFLRRLSTLTAQWRRTESYRHSINKKMGFRNKWWQNVIMNCAKQTSRNRSIRTVYNKRFLKFHLKFHTQFINANFIRVVEGPEMYDCTWIVQLVCNSFAFQSQIYDTHD